MQEHASGVRVILISTIGIFLMQMIAGENAIVDFALWPLQEGFKPWQLITYALLHGSVMHLFFNMYGLWMFGSEMERLLGRRTFLKLYVASVLTAGITQLLVTSSSGNVYPTVGASGGVFGLLLAYGMIYPNRIIMLLIPPIPLPAWLFVTIYAVIELYLGVSGSLEGIAHFAHLGGMLGGFWVVRSWLRRVRRY